MCCGFGGRPGPRLAWLSYLAPAYLRNHRVSVSGVTSEPSSRILGVGEKPCLQGEPAALCVGEAQPSSAEHLPERPNLLSLVHDDRVLLAMNPAGQHHQNRAGRSATEVQCHVRPTIRSIGRSCGLVRRAKAWESLLHEGDRVLGHYGMRHITPES